MRLPPHTLTIESTIPPAVTLDEYRRARVQRKPRPNRTHSLFVIPLRRRSSAGSDDAASAPGTTPSADETELRSRAVSHGSSLASDERAAPVSPGRGAHPLDPTLPPAA